MMHTHGPHSPHSRVEASCPFSRLEVTRALSHVCSWADFILQR